MTRKFSAFAGYILLAGLFAGVTQATSAESSDVLEGQDAPRATVTVPSGTRVPLVMINSVSSKHSQAGDPVYLESVYPVVVDGRILIPAGTNVSGTVTRTKRPGRIKGRGQLLVRIDQLILPNGVIRDLSGRPGALDGRSPDSLDRETGQVQAEGTKGEDAEDIITATAQGASIGTIAGAAAGRVGSGLGIGTAIGAGAGVAKVLLTRGADALLDRGTHIEMFLERDLHFAEDEVQFDGTGDRPGAGAGPDPQRNRRPTGPARGLGRLPL